MRKGSPSPFQSVELALDIVFGCPDIKNERWLNVVGFGCSQLASRVVKVPTLPFGLGKGVELQHAVVGALGGLFADGDNERGQGVWTQHLQKGLGVWAQGNDASLNGIAERYWPHERVCNLGRFLSG